MSSLRTTRKAFTLVELLVVLGVASIVLGGLGMLYVAAMRGMVSSVAELSAAGQASSAMRSMQWSVRNAIRCDARTKNGVTALRCTMPTLGIYLNDPSNPSSYRGPQVDKFGRQGYESGNRVWYYTADATGAYGTAGTTLWRAIRSDDADATASDVDAPFTYDYGRTTTPRFPLVTGLAVTVDASSLLVTLGLTVESVDYASHTASSSDASNQRRGVTLTQQAFCENWRTSS